MKVIGLTGSIATGKSTVSDFFRELGAYAIDLDKIVHLLLKEDRYIYKAITAHFGKKVLDKNGKIDRRKLSKKVFTNKKELNALCSLIHPLVIKILKSELSDITTKNPNAIVVVDAPLLIEAGLLDLVDTVIVVRAEVSLQIKRGIKKFRLSRGDIARRISSQMPLKEKERFADFIIDNSFTKSNTRDQVKRIFDLVYIKS